MRGLDHWAILGSYMKYFAGYNDALDPVEDREPKRLKPVDPGLDCLPFDHLEDRRFETLTYRLKLAEHASRARVFLMQGVGERGRDVVVYTPDGRLAEIVQCKRLRSRMTAPELRRELLKLAIHAFLEPEILGPGPVRYELWCPGGLAEPALDLIARWPTQWTEDKIGEDALKVLGEYTAFSGLSWESAKAYVVDEFSRVVTVTLQEGVDISVRARRETAVYQDYFQANIVLSANDTKETLRHNFDAVDERLRRLEFLHACEKPLRDLCVVLFLKQPILPSVVGDFVFFVEFCGHRGPGRRAKLSLAVWSHYPVAFLGGGRELLWGTCVSAWDHSPLRRFYFMCSGTMDRSVHRIETRVVVEQEISFATLESMEDAYISPIIPCALWENLEGFIVAANGYELVRATADTCVPLERDWKDFPGEFPDTLRGTPLVHLSRKTALTDTNGPNWTGFRASFTPTPSLMTGA
ncbi:hypothetical protein [Sorangium sp. So ce887]|uniref:hypothetical protein n=1 Tax=Sorangium sp. So ce887 TaxID=3133324 RepID=UPI003F6351EF